jgi:hypothetical protein
LQRKANVQDPASVRGQKEKVLQHGTTTSKTQLSGEKGKGKKGKKGMKGKDSVKGMPSRKAKEGKLELQLQLHYANYTTLQLQLKTTTPLRYSYTYTYNYNCTTPHYIQQLW